MSNDQGELARRASDLEVALMGARVQLRALRTLITIGDQISGFGERMQQLSDEELLAYGFKPHEIPIVREVLSPLRNFSWLEDFAIAGCARPLSRKGVEALVSLGVDRIVTLTDDPLPESWLSGLDVITCHVPMPDFGALETALLRRAVDLIDEGLGAGHKVAVHCVAGRGRTGAVLAAFLVSRGETPDRAMETIRRLRPTSIESGAQEDAIRSFALADPE